MLIARSWFGARDGTLRWLDRFVIGVLMLLVVLTPLAIGSVRRGAFVAMEIGAFSLVLIWMARYLIDGVRPAWDSQSAREARRLAWPVLAMVLLLLLQLTPMPSRMLRLLSPSTYRVYEVAFPDWPHEDPYQGLLKMWSEPPASGAPAEVSLLPPVGKTRRPDAAKSPGVSPLASAAPEPHGLEGFKWRTLSLSPSATSESLLELLALSAVFFVVLLYPFGLVGEREAQVRFLRIMIYLIVATAAAIAFIGIVERAWWNGKILWFYIPTDWGGPYLVESPRASGPFVDPDHFANYLSMVLPLAVAGSLFSFSVIPRHQRSNARLFFAAAAVLMLIGVVLSISRGGGAAACVGATVTLVLCFTWARDRAPAYLQRLGLRAIPVSIATFALMMLMVIYLIGAPARSQVGERLSRTSSNDFSARLSAWRETLPMIADFPLVGVGLGAWPEFFPHYQKPPASQYFYFRAAEDDYIQFAAETGITGFAILLVFGALVVAAITSRASRMPARRWPLFAGLLGGLCGGLTHEWVDLSFHIPANVLLFTLILALALRVVLSDPASGEIPRLKTAEATADRSILALIPAAVAVALIVLAWRQQGRAYPFNVDQASDLADAERNLTAHPAMSAAHVTLARMMPAGAADLRRSQLQAASWLEPNQALAHDLYARSLLLSGDKAGALQQISISVYRAPFLVLHYYLAPSAIPWLLPDEQQAIAHGFEHAIDSRFTSAADEMASFYGQLGRYRDAGDGYVRAARLATDDSRKFEFLLKAGRNYARAGAYVSGKQVLLAASAIDAEDPRPYTELAENIDGPAKKVAAARAIISQGIDRGADPYTLEMALASAAEKAGDHAVAEAALMRALQDDPSFDATLWLGKVYLEENRLERAVATLQQATEMNPNSSDAFMWLGRAHESNYDYFAADRAYARAVALAPSNTTLRDDYEGFQKRTAVSAKQASAATAAPAHSK